MADAVLRAFAEGTAPDSSATGSRLRDLGLHLLAVPEAFGGLQAGARTFHAVAEALGRSLQSTTAFATSALAATRLVATLADGTQRSSLLDALAGGTSPLALAIHEAGADHDLVPARTIATPHGGGWRVDGRKVSSLNSERAGRWIVSARTPAGEPCLLIVDDGMPGLTVRRFPTIDGAQACDLVLEGVTLGADRCLGAPGTAALDALQGAVDLAELALCAEAVGIQARLLDDTVRHVKERRQFGQALGSFQVIQHRLAEMLVALEQARSLAWLLASEFDAATPQRRAWLVSAAKVRCIVSGRFIGLQAIHLHGGMGMTDELPVGRCVKRLLAIEHAFGDERFHLGRIARRLAAATPSLQVH